MAQKSKIRSGSHHPLNDFKQWTPTSLSNRTESVMQKPSLTFNPVVRGMPEASSIFVNQVVHNLKQLGEDVTTLSLGEAFFDIPRFDFAKIDFAKSHHYSESMGLFDLRLKIAGYHHKRYNSPVDPQTEILISAGSKPLIYMAMLTALAAGDEVLIHEPSWLSYPEQARLAGAVPKFIPYDATIGSFESYFTPRTRMLVICNPNNPAGHIYSRADLREIYDLCRSRGVYLLVDEAYSEFVVGDEFVSIAEVVPDKTGIILVNSLSKNLGISGWRIGYIIAHSEFVAELLKTNQHIITCAPTILQMYCAEYFDQLLEITLPQVRQVVEKRQRVASLLTQAGLTSLGGNATFYFFVSIGNFPGTSQEFAMNLLLKDRVGVVPGSAYGESTDRFVRISIGTETEPRIAKAFAAIRKMTLLNSFDGGALSDQMASIQARMDRRDTA
jgi:aspartate aminotransferase/aminotransferase